MMGFIRAVEATTLAAGMAVANGGRGQVQDRVVRITNRGTIDRLIAVLRQARHDRDQQTRLAIDLADENRRLRTKLERTRRALLIAARQRPDAA